MSVINKAATAPVGSARTAGAKSSSFANFVFRLGHESEVKFDSMSSENFTPLNKKPKLNVNNMENVLEEKTTSPTKRQCNQNDSPDMFSDSESPLEYFQTVPDVAIQIEADPSEACVMERDLSSHVAHRHVDDEMDCGIEVVNKKSWRGVSLADISTGCDSPQLPRIASEENHYVLFKLPVVPGRIPAPYPDAANRIDAWDGNHVRLPCSEQSLYPVGKELISRWALITETLSKPITNSRQLAEAILTYNKKFVSSWDFSTLHHFFEKEMEEAETECFFAAILPEIISLALRLPELVTSPIPLLRQHRPCSVSLGQVQIASLLANAFLCTFPRRNTDSKKSEYANYPDVNFTQLFGRPRVASRMKAKMEKLKCFFYYMRKVCVNPPVGTITFTRRYIAKASLPRWDRSERALTPIHVTSNGTIEDQGGGMLQVDFANKFVGGGVLNSGCVQEEIRFMICPELIVSRLFTEVLDATEALLITGAERYSNYSGYSDTFEWQGEHEDETPRDSSGRRACSIVAIDAEMIHNAGTQFQARRMLREVNKAYVGFFNPDLPVDDRLAPVATGNWGCGAFGGKATLKALIQVMAAAEAGRSVVYFTFGEEQLRDEIHEMHTFLVDKHVTVGRLWHLLSHYHEQTFRQGKPTQELYGYLYDAVLTRRSVARPRQTTLDSAVSVRTKKDCPGSSKPTSHCGESSRNFARPEHGLDANELQKALFEADELQKALAESSRTEHVPNGFEFKPEDLQRALASVDDSLEAKLARIESTPSKVPKPGSLFEALDALDSCKSPKRSSAPASQHSPAKFLEAFQRREEAKSSMTVVDKIVAETESKLKTVQAKERIIIPDSSSDSEVECDAKLIEDGDVFKAERVCEHSLNQLGKKNTCDKCDKILISTEEMYSDSVLSEVIGSPLEVTSSGSSVATNSFRGTKKDDKASGSEGLSLKSDKSSINSPSLSNSSGRTSARNSAPQRRISDYFSSMPRTQ